MRLRDYQEELITNIKQSILKGNRSIIVQSPPRSGKTVVMAHIAKGATDKGNKVLFFSHRKEINEQVYKTFKNNEVNISPAPDTMIKEGDTLIVVADNKKLNELNRMK